MTVGTTLRFFREARGLTQRQLAERAAVTQSSIAACESGRYGPSLRVAVQLCGALDVTLDDLLRPDATPRKEQNQ